ncbi:MAG: hypothetical protein MRY74_04435 [Neomegalonema sp.]|nr:hypothetical protein [Neomegalonema sp.]
MSSHNTELSPSPRRASLGGLVRRIIGRFVVGVMLALGALGVVLFSLSLLSEPSTLSVIRAESETLRFTVANGREASFQLDGLRLYGEGAFDKSCAAEALGPNGAVEPKIGVEIVYTITAAGQLAIQLRAPEDEVERATARELAALSGPKGVISVTDDILMRSDPACGPMRAKRFPVWGPGEIGGAPTFRADGPSPTLISGALEMYGRAVPISWNPASWFKSASARSTGARSDDRALYASLSSAFQIPPGSRVSTLPGDKDQALQPLKALRGFALRHDGVLKVAVSTESPEVFFFPPGADSRPDRLKMSLLSQIGNDPNLQRIFQLIVWFAVVLPIALELIKPIFVRPGEDA